MVSICQLLSKNSSMTIFTVFLICYFLPVISPYLPLFVSFVYVYPRGIPYSLAVRISNFHPGGPGSTPGMLGMEPHSIENHSPVKFQISKHFISKTNIFPHMEITV